MLIEDIKSHPVHKCLSYPWVNPVMVALRLLGGDSLVLIAWYEKY